MPARVLLDVADAPRRPTRMQVHRQLRVVLAGECVELARSRHHVEHVRRIDARADRFGKRLHALHELRVFDLVERASAAGQLHAGLQLAVAPPRERRLPLAALHVETFDEDELAAHVTLRRQMREDDIAADRRLEGDRREGVDQRIELDRQPLRGAARGRQRRVGGERLDLVGCRRVERGGRTVAFARRRGARLLARRGRALRAGAPRLPRAMGDDAGEYDSAQRRERDRQRAHRRCSAPLPTAPEPPPGAGRRRPPGRCFI